MSEYQLINEIINKNCKWKRKIDQNQSFCALIVKYCVKNS